MNMTGGITFYTIIQLLQDQEKFKTTAPVLTFIYTEVINVIN